MASELTQAIQQVAEDKKIPLDSIIETIESALAAAYRKDFGDKSQNIKVAFDMETGGFKVTDVKEIVEDKLKEEYEKIKEEKMKLAELEAAGKLTDEQKQKIEEDKQKEIAAAELAKLDGAEEVKKFNPKTMISLSEAKEIKKTAKLGTELVQKLEVPGDFGRMAAQTAKQVVIQKLREAERNLVLDEYKDKVGELLTGTVQRIERGTVLIDFGNATAVMPLEEGIRTEKYIPGARFKFYVKNVEETARNPRIVVSRTHPDIIRKLFKLEVPEIASGSVQIKSIAREAGSRTKIAVVAKEDSIDPIGSCVGQRGTRVQTIINEIGGEKIDIIEWEEDPAKFIAKALSPAKIIRVEVAKPINNKQLTNNKEEEKEKKELSSAEVTDGKEDKEEKDKIEEVKEAKVYVIGDQLSLAIGKEGQNVRLAAKLTGWKIDIVEESIDKEQLTDNKGEEGKEEKKDKSKKNEKKDEKEKKEVSKKNKTSETSKKKEEK